MELKVKETCKCGASFEGEGFVAEVGPLAESKLWRILEQFRDAHKECLSTSPNKE